MLVTRRKFGRSNSPEPLPAHLTAVLSVDFIWMTLRSALARYGRWWACGRSGLLPAYIRAVLHDRPEVFRRNERARTPRGSFGNHLGDICVQHTGLNMVSKRRLDCHVYDGILE